MTKFSEAKRFVLSTLKSGDAEKWCAYNKLGSAGKLHWCKVHGHAEFCRLQRLSFYSAIPAVMASK